MHAFFVVRFRYDTLDSVLRKKTENGLRVKGSIIEGVMRGNQSELLTAINGYY